MFLIAGQEEDYEAGVSALFLTSLTPLHISPSSFSLSSDQAQRSLPDLGLWPKGPFSPTLPFSSLQGIVWNFQGASFRAMSGCWVTEQLPFFILRVGMSRVTVRGCIVLCMRLVVITAWELSLEHPPTTCSVGAQNIAGWNLRLALLICAFHTLSCLLTALPTGPNCNLWAKKKLAGLVFTGI